MSTWAMAGFDVVDYSSTNVSYADMDHSGTLVLQKVGTSLLYSQEGISGALWLFKDIISAYSAEEAGFGLTLYTHSPGAASVDIVGINYETAPVRARGA